VKFIEVQRVAAMAIVAAWKMACGTGFAANIAIKAVERKTEPFFATSKARPTMKYRHIELPSFRHRARRLEMDARLRRGDHGPSGKQI